MAADTRRPAPTAQRKFWEWYARVYVVPRRWSVSSLLLITTLYAVLCGALQAVRAPVTVLVAISAFLLFVGLSQLVLPRTPRFASACAGVLYFCVGYGVSAARNTNLPPLIPETFFILAMSGGILGYLAGSILAGIFLVGDFLQEFWRWWWGR